MSKLPTNVRASFMVFAKAGVSEQVRDSEPVPKCLGAVPPDAAKSLKRPENCGLAAHGPAHLPPVCGTDRVPQSSVGSPSAPQCDMSTGTVMLPSRVRLAPPSTISRIREWP